MRMIAFAAVALAVVTMSGTGEVLAQAKQAPAKEQAKSQPPAPPPLKQIALTDKQVESFLAAQAEIDAATSKLPPGDPNKPDPKVEAQIEAIVKKNGFASLPEYGDVFGNIALVMSGIDPKTKAFTDPPELIAREIKTIESSKQMPAKAKSAALAELKAAQASTAKVQFAENVPLITKYYDKLSPLFTQEEEEAPPPPAKGAPAKKK